MVIIVSKLTDLKCIIAWMNVVRQSKQFSVSSRLISFLLVVIIFEKKINNKLLMAFNNHLLKQLFMLFSLSFIKSQIAYNFEYYVDLHES